MAHSRNDYHRNRFRDFDDDYNYRTEVQERKAHRKDKRISNALRSKNIDDLMRDFDDEYDSY